MLGRKNSTKILIKMRIKSVAFFSNVMYSLTHVMVLIVLEETS